MTKTFDLTANEFKAAHVLVQACLDGMGGSRPADLERDEYTWTDADTLIQAGWSKHEAAGTWGALTEKGFIQLHDKTVRNGKKVDEYVVATSAWKWMDTVWDAPTEQTPAALAPRGGMNREGWLNAIADQLRTEFAAYGKPLPLNIRMSCGFTGGSKRAIGICYYPADEKSATEIFIHPNRADVIEVGATLIHELCHAALGPGFGHGKEFGAIARHFGLEGKLTATHAGIKTKELLDKAIAVVGAYPHTALNAGGAADGPKPQKAIKHVNLNCPECQFHAKVWVAQMGWGRLTCPVDGEILETKEERRLREG